MSYTLLELVDQVSGELGLVQPTTVIGSATNQTQQFLALAQRLGKEKNWLKKDLDLKEALGIGITSARQAYDVARIGKFPPRSRG